MAIATLKFNLKDESDKEEFIHAQKGWSYKCALDDIYNQIIRKRRKYAELTEEQSKMIEEISDEYAQILRDYDVEL